MEIVLLEILGIKNALNILEDLIKEKFKTKGGPGWERYLSGRAG